MKKVIFALGILFFFISISASSQINTIPINASLEMYGKDLGIMNWDDAVIECKKIGHGWRLPDKNELELIFNKFRDFRSNESIANLNQTISYWTSSIDNNKVYNNCLFFGFKQGSYDYKNFKLLVRPVRELSNFNIAIKNKGQADASLILNNLEIMYQDLDLDNFKELFDKKGVNLPDLGYNIGEGYSYHYRESHGYEFKGKFYNSKEFSYNSVLNILKLIGNDWRLPTLNELKIIYTNKSIIPNLNKKNQQEYLSIGLNINNKENELVDIMDLNGGRTWQDYNTNNRELSVRLVKSFNSKISLSDTLIFKKRTIKIDYLEIMSDDIGFMNYNEAIKLSSELGNGWRLPTKYEVDNILFKNKKLIGGFEDGQDVKSGYFYYSENNEESLWLLAFSGSAELRTNKKSNAYVRLVRDLKKENLLLTKRIGNLEVMLDDVGKMNYDFAKQSANQFDDGWRLPKLNELKILYLNKISIGNFTNNVYWSNEERNKTQASTFDIGKGIEISKDKIRGNIIEIYGSKDEIHYVRLVRSVIPKNGIIKIGNLEVFKQDIGKMDWINAQIKCKELGKGWKLPDEGELKVLYLNKNFIPGLTNSIYWSSIKRKIDKAQYLFMQSGFVGEESIKSNFNVRPVRIVN